MTKQAEREFAQKIDPQHLYRKPFDYPAGLREFAIVLNVFRRLPAGASVLDLGCGPGWTTLFLAKAGFSVTGVDISERMIEIAEERCRLESVSANLVVADIEELELHQHAFQGVLLYDALHHCPNYTQVLHRAYEHMATGGYLLLLEPSQLHLYSPRARAFSHTYGVTELGFSRRKLRLELRRAGFRYVSHFYDAGDAFYGVAGLLIATFRLWCSYFYCFPRMKQIVLAQK